MNIYTMQSSDAMHSKLSTFHQNPRIKHLTYEQSYLNQKYKPIIPKINDLFDSQTKIFVDSISKIKPFYLLSAKDARKALDNIQSDQSYKILVDIVEYPIPTTVGNINIKIFTKKNRQNKSTIIYFHGGGWVLGDSQTHGRLLADIVNNTNSSLVYIEFTPAPEKKYPIQLVQGYDIIKYLSQRSEMYGLNMNKTIIMGDSAGANLATVITLISSSRNDPKIHYQILAYPVTDLSMNTLSYELYQNGPWLTKKSMEWYADSYIPANVNRSIPAISPLNTPLVDLQMLPPTLIITAENDVLRDEGEEYAHKLMTAGIDVTSVRFLGTIHDFLMLDPLKDTPAAKSARQLIYDKIKNI